MGFLYVFLVQRWPSDPSIDFHTKWHNRRGFAQGRAFCNKNRNFVKPVAPRPVKPDNFGKFSDLENLGQQSPSRPLYKIFISKRPLIVNWSTINITYVVNRQ